MVSSHGFPQFFVFSMSEYVSCNLDAFTVKWIKSVFGIERKDTHSSLKILDPGLCTARCGNESDATVIT